MNSLMTLVSTDKNIVSPAKDSNSKSVISDEKIDTTDFITILYDQIKDSVKTTSKPEILTLSANSDTQKDFKNSDKAKSSDELLLDEILSIVNQLKVDNTTTDNFPKFSDKMDKIISNESIKSDFKNVKNLNDILKLSKKYDLGLKDINLTKESVDNLKKDFPKLDMEKFFETKVDKKTDNFQNKNRFPTDNKKESFINKISKDSLNTKPKEEQNSTLQNLLKKIDAKENTITDSKLSTDTTQKKDMDIKAQVEKKHIDKSSTIKPVKNVKEIVPKNVKEKIVHKNISKKRTITDNIKQQKNQMKQNIQDQILHKIKSQKDIISFNQNNMPNNKTDDDCEVKSKDVKSEPTNHKQEFKNSIQTDNSKTVKHSQAKDSLNHFANDLKEKIEQYKSPLMKLKMALNPKNLGEVEVTLVNRGNNLHVNITSNTNAMSLFTQNQAEFKNSLVNMGFTNLEMNFSDQGQNSRQNQQNSKKQSNSFEEFNQQENSENSIELIVPRYI